MKQNQIKQVMKVLQNIAGKRGSKNAKTQTVTKLDGNANQNINEITNTSESHGSPGLHTAR